MPEHIPLTGDDEGRVRVVRIRHGAVVAIAAALLSLPSLAARSGPALTPGAAQPAAPPRTDNLVALEMGGRVENRPSRPQGFEPERALDGNPSSYFATVGDPEIVLSFIGRDTALVGEVTVRNPSAAIKDGWVGDMKASWPASADVWLSTTSPSAGFVKAATATLPADESEHRIALPKPSQARFVKLVLHGKRYGGLTTSEIAVHEGAAPGYTPLLKRHPDLAALLATGKLTPDAASLAYQAPGASSASCTVPVAAPPACPESQHVLVVEKNVMYWPESAGMARQPPPAVRYFPDDPGKGLVDTSIVQRADFMSVQPDLARPALLVPSANVDTVVLEQVCDIKTSVSAGFKQALVAWVANGNKLIVSDADSCGPGSVPDYSFLPYPFETSNPGASARASNLQIVEQNFLVSPDSRDPAFLDEPSWRLKKNGNTANDLGDSNTVIKYDDHWCGALVGTNALGASGFVLAYAHYGRGVILYDGIDRDQYANPAYEQYTSRQLRLPFRPDPLPCTLRLAPFAVTTDVALVDRHVKGGEALTYPLMVLATKPGFAGTITMSAAPESAGANVPAHFEPATVTLGAHAAATLTLTAPAQLARPLQLAVRGVSGAATSTLCLTLDALRSGRVTLTADLGPAPPAATRKNLLIILDLSGSMNAVLGKSTRIATARQVLHTVLSKVPDDFNVGLRVYGDRFGSKQKETCTDSHLVQPVQKLDRTALTRLIDAAKPRGETPLVYSVLQAIGDLKAAGGGSVVLITDGEESCGGDFAAAAAAIKQSGLDFRLSIVGFTLQGPQARRSLAALATATGGAYYAAQSGEALSRALVTAAISSFPFSIKDASGKVVAQGEAGDSGHDVPPGDYTIVVQAGDRTITLPHVAVALGQTHALRVTRKGDGFALEQ
jgi:hypothetical protein